MVIPIRDQFVDEAWAVCRRDGIEGIRNDALKIMLDGVDHFVFQPQEMYLDFGLGGVQSVGIRDNENAWQIVLLRDPPMLPRPAANA